MEYRTLRNGAVMPMEGFGVYQVEPDEAERVVSGAIAAGYRSIDTAASYFNEEAVGRAVRASGLPRGAFFLTSKVWVQDFGYEKTKRAVETSLEKLGTDYLDLMLLHQSLSDYYGAWRALEELYEAGTLRAIGVANFYPERLTDLCCNAHILPMVNQIECHPFFQRGKDLEAAAAFSVAVEAAAAGRSGAGRLLSSDRCRAGGEIRKDPGADRSPVERSAGRHRHPEDSPGGAHEGKSRHLGLRPRRKGHGGDGRSRHGTHGDHRPLRLEDCEIPQRIQNSRLNGKGKACLPFFVPVRRYAAR